jgi:hypothetical protein
MNLSNMNNMNNMNINMNINHRIISLEDNQKELNKMMLSLQNEISALKINISNIHETFNNTLSLLLKNNDNMRERNISISSDDSSSSDSSCDNDIYNEIKNNTKNKDNTKNNGNTKNKDNTKNKKGSKNNMVRRRAF